MAEELGTRDVFEQIDSRLGNVEQDIRTLGTDLRTEMTGLRSDVRLEISGLRTEMHARFAETNAFSRWIIGMVLVSWLSLMTSIWLKP